MIFAVAHVPTGKIDEDGDEIEVERDVIIRGRGIRRKVPRRYLGAGTRVLEAYREPIRSAEAKRKCRKIVGSKQIQAGG